MQRTKQTQKRALHNSMTGIKDHAAGVGSSVRDLGEAVKDVLFEKLTDMLKRAGADCVPLGPPPKSAPSAKP